MSASLSATPMKSSPLRSRSSLFPYQEQAVRLMVERQQMAALLKMGLGKTAITLTALRDLGARRTLVLAPAQVVKRDVWGREARAWDHCACFDVAPLVGTPKQRQRAIALARHTARPTLDVCSYENAIWLSDAVDLGRHYDAIVFDELSRMKSPGTARFRRLRARSMAIPIRFGLTGSPVGNRLLDLWGEMFMVANEKPLGPTFTAYRARYFVPEGRDPRFAVWHLRDEAAAKEIHQRVAPYSFSLDERLAAERLPEVRVNPIDLELPKEVRALEAQLASECRAHLASGAELRALSASTLAGKVRQLASGAVYTTPEGEDWEEVHAVKVDALREVLEEQQGEPVLCFFWFRHELERLKRAFPEAREVREHGALDAWDRREVPLMLAHPQSAGHGLNLQAGGSTVVWLTLPWSHELWEQGNGRLARPGQRAPVVTAHVLLAGDADSAVYSVLGEKGDVQGALMESVRLIDPSDPIFGT